MKRNIDLMRFILLRRSNWVSGLSDKLYEFLGLRNSIRGVYAFRFYLHVFETNLSVKVEGPSYSL